MRVLSLIEMGKSLKIELDVTMYESIVELQNSNAIDYLVDKVYIFFNTKEKTANRNVIVKACKSAICLLSSKKRNIAKYFVCVCAGKSFGISARYGCT